MFGLLVRITTENGARTWENHRGPILPLRHRIFPFRMRIITGRSRKSGTSFEGADRSRTAAVDPGGRPWKSGDYCGFPWPRAVSNLHMTRHVIREYGLKSNEHMKMHQISGIVPGVMAQTGMELWKLFGVLFLRQSRIW